MRIPVKTRIMFAITHIGKDNKRILSRPNQGHNHFDTKEFADICLYHWNTGNDEKTLEQVFGKQAIGTFAIRQVECYLQGDAKSIYFDS